MKIINVQQGTPEWLSWRKTVITATDCPAILGSSPWATAYQCWQRKLGLLDEQPVNSSMERGRILEPIAREAFIETYGIEMDPAVVESDTLEYLGASLDGLSRCGRYILEIKCGGNKLHSMAQEGKIPQYYQDQIQHQLLVTGAQKAFYYQFNGEEGICVEVFPDMKFKEAFLPVANKFWKCVFLNEPPELQALDYKDMSEDPLWEVYAQNYLETIQKIKLLEEHKESYREELLKLCADQPCIGRGIKVIKTMMKGRVAYDEIPEMQGVDVEKYRKSPTTTWKILNHP
jgi:putative phage-type endonuclease